VRWTGGDPECSHEDREATGDAQQVKYVLRGTLGGVQVCGEWDDPKLAELAAAGLRAHGGRATVLKVTTEEVPTGV
jgi:hypothetical protein